MNEVIRLFLRRLKLLIRVCISMCFETLLFSYIQVDANSGGCLKYSSECYELYVSFAKHSSHPALLLLEESNYFFVAHVLSGAQHHFSYK